MIRRSICCALVLLICGCAEMGSMGGATAASPRQRTSINLDWRFTKNDPDGTGDKLAYANIKNWMMSTGEDLVVDPAAPRHARPAENIGADVAYTTGEFNDSQWRQLHLPHDWAADGPFNIQAPGETGKLPFAGVAWYRRKLEIPATDTGKQIYLDIDGAMSYANVWLNGQYAGGWGYGYSSFRIDLTPYVKPGGDNVLAIRLDNPGNSSRWYPGSGIYRNVWLVKTSPVHVAHWGTYVTTPQVERSAATVDLSVKVDNDSKTEANVTVKSQIFAIDVNDRKLGGPVASTEPVTLQIATGKNNTAVSKASIKNPKLWGTTTPNRYVAVTTIEQNGAVVDSYETPFGVRTTKFDPDKGFFLNGELVRFNGVCNHHDLGAVGSAVHFRALQRQLEIIREMGCNAIRTSHNPPAPELLDLADKMGFLVFDETFDCWAQAKRPNDYHLIFNEWSEKDTRMLIRRDRNHPSVVMWSIGNEIPEQASERGRAIATRLAGIVRSEDPTRPVTMAVNNESASTNGLQKILDIFGFNYLRGQGLEGQMTLYSRFHKNTPDKMVFSSESASTISSRGFYVFPVTDEKLGGYSPADRQMSSYDLYAPQWATPPDWEFKAQDTSGVAAGEFVWTGFDYLGEPTVNAGNRGRGAATGPATAPGQARGRGPAGPDPRRSSYFGIIDLAGFPKDRYYIYQSRWRPDLPMAHILPHWNWPERVGEVTPVHVYTSGDEGELFINGKSQGKRKKAQYEYRLRWDDVKYEPGEVKVVAYKNGKQWAQDVMKTTGPETKLAIKPDRAKIKADGQDLSFVTVSITDKDGQMVPRTMNRVSFQISGPGEIIATDNGNPIDLDSFPQAQRNAFNGLCLAIIRSKPGQPGTITVRATAEGLTAAQTTINTSR